MVNLGDSTMSIFLKGFTYVMGGVIFNLCTFITLGASDIDSQCTDKTVALIAKFEGFYPAVYKCAANVDTIGYGHVLEPEDGFTLSSTLTQAEALDLLKQDIIKKADIRPALLKPETLSANEMDALTSLTFNLGTLNIGGSFLVARLNEGKKEEALDCFAPWRCVTDPVDGSMKPLEGLMKRRLAELMIFTGKPLCPESDELPSEQYGLTMPYTDRNWTQLKQADKDKKFDFNVTEAAVKIATDYLDGTL